MAPTRATAGGPADLDRTRQDSFAAASAAAHVARLASGENTDITGQVLGIDGGSSVTF